MRVFLAKLLNCGNIAVRVESYTPALSNCPCGICLNSLNDEGNYGVIGELYLFTLGDAFKLDTIESTGEIQDIIGGGNAVVSTCVGRACFLQLKKA